jgi:hypothetical protein
VGSVSHFAELDPNNIVTQVIVADSQEWCEENLGGRWVQTSYTGSIRGRYAGIGMKYDETLDEFVEVENA